LTKNNIQFSHLCDSIRGWDILLKKIFFNTDVISGNVFEDEAFQSAVFRAAP
jgi:hypothetical protein